MLKWLSILLLLGSLSPLTQSAPTIHVYVALADNTHQGIVKVPEALGNGDDPANNLYWGALYGVQAWFTRDAHWTVLRTETPAAPAILERIVFQHPTGAILTAEAYRGRDIQKATTDFFTAVSGGLGKADLVAYIGHNGLMDFQLRITDVERGKDGADAIVLACQSDQYYGRWLKIFGARPTLLTTNFMAPEAYVLDAALDGWLAKDAPENLRERAASAYHAYQKCGLNPARRLFVSRKKFVSQKK